MPTLVPCPCGKRIKFPDHAAGKRAKCPACGNILTAPMPEPPAPADDLYELDAPADLQPARAAPATATLEHGPAGPAARPTLSKGLDVNSPFYRAASGRVAARMAEAEKGGKPLFNILGVDVTPLKLMGFLLLLLPVVGIPTWFYTLGPGVDARINSVRTVQAVTLLQGLDTQEPYSLFTGLGNRSLGVKGPKLRNAPASMAATIDLQYTVGGGEELILVRPDPSGGQVLVEVEVSHALIQSLDRLSQYKIHINARDFSITPEGGGAAEQPKLLFAAFDDRVGIDLTGPNAIGHDSLVPTGVTPSQETLQRGSGGGVASGVIRYDGNGVNGEFRFTSSYYASGAPGARGLYADGQVTRFTADGTQVEYDYDGSALEVSWDAAPHRAAWWARGGFKDNESFNPWEKVRVTLLFDRPPGDGRVEVAYCGEPIGTANLAKAVKLAERDAKETDAKANRKSAFGPGTGPQDPLTGYFKLLVDARQKARGVVAMSNLNQIGMGIGMYAEANGGRMPESLYDLRSVFPNIDDLLVNLRTGENPGFIYEKPAETFAAIRDPMRTPIVWELENGRKKLDGSILYADGHIESPLAP